MDGNVCDKNHNRTISDDLWRFGSPPINPAGRVLINARHRDSRQRKQICRIDQGKNPTTSGKRVRQITNYLETMRRASLAEGVVTLYERVDRAATVAMIAITHEQVRGIGGTPELKVPHSATLA